MNPLFLITIPLLLIPVLAHGQQEQMVRPHELDQQVQGAPIQPIHFANTTFNMYNENSGSISSMQFNPDHTFNRILNGNNLTGIWSSSIQTLQVLRLCPTATDDGKSTDKCLNVGIRANPDNQNDLSFLDLHGNHLKKDR